MLKNETDRAIIQRNAAQKEMQRLRDELEYKRNYDHEYERKLMVALTRYNPGKIHRTPHPDSSLVPSVAPFRGGALVKSDLRRDKSGHLENYEKIFFNNIEACGGRAPPVPSEMPYPGETAIVGSNEK